jgi:nitrogen regulatory protein PII
MKVKKIEIIINSLELNKVTRMIDDADIPGYTIIKDAQGKGLRGVIEADELTDVFKNSYVMTACSQEKAEKLIEKLRPFIAKYGGSCIVSDAEWIEF